MQYVSSFLSYGRFALLQLSVYMFCLFGCYVFLLDCEDMVGKKALIHVCVLHSLPNC